MSWKDDKNLGPWKFFEQPDRWGYLNNPRWTKDPKAVAFASKVGLSTGPTAKHAPCGHWHKHKEIAPSPPGNLYTVGYNRVGQLGIAISEEQGAGCAIATQVPYTESKTWVQVASGSYHSLAIASDGTLWSSGTNNSGQLGLGDTVTRWRFTQVGTDTDWSSIYCGYNFSIAIKTDGTLWGCGDNSTYQLGFPDGNNRLVFTQIGTDSDWLMAAGGDVHMVAVKTTGELYGCGYTKYGELGYGSGTTYLTTLTLLSPTDIVFAACSEECTYVIDSSGYMYVTGENGWGELGLGHNDIVYTFTMHDNPEWSHVACAAYSAMAIKTDGSLWSCGVNSQGELAQGDYDERYSWEQVGTDTDWETVYGHYFCMYARKTNGRLYFAGENGSGNCGNGEYGSAINTLTYVPGSFISGAALVWSSMFINSDGELLASGYNYFGCMGTGPNYVEKYSLVNDDTWIAISSFDSHTLGIRNDNTLWGWGDNQSYQIGEGYWSDGYGYMYWRPHQFGKDYKDWIMVSTGYGHSIALRSNGQIYGCGDNIYGQVIKTGPYGEIYTRIVLSLLSGRTDWVFINAHGNGTFAIDADGYLWATGCNSGSSEGLLGLGDGIDRHDFTKCIGEGWKQVSGGS